MVFCLLLSQISIFFHFLARVMISESMRFFWAIAHLILTIFIFFILSREPGARHDPGAWHDSGARHDPVARHDPGTWHDPGAQHDLAAGVSYQLYIGRSVIAVITGNIICTLYHDILSTRSLYCHIARPSLNI